VFPKHSGEPAPLLTKKDLKSLAGEADLALAEAKGKIRPDLRPRGPGEVPGDKNRVCSFVWQEVGEAGAPPGPARTGRVFCEKRKSERYNVSTPFLFRVNGGFKVAKTVNISLEGARIVSDTPPPEGPALDAILVSEDRATPVKCAVIYTEKGGGEPGFFYTGVNFRDLTFRESRDLERYLLHFRRRDANP
jgi:hypothetical protein